MRSSWLAGVCGMTVVWGMAVPVFGQETPQPQIRMGLYMQPQFHTSSAGSLSNTFELRRARVRVQVDLGNGITGHFEPDFGQGQVRLRYAYADMTLGAVTFRAGQFKRPFSMLNLTSSSLFPLTERSVRIDGLEAAYGAAGAPNPRIGSLVLLGEEQRLLEQLGYYNYDIGAMLRGRAGGLTVDAAVFNGNGWAATDDAKGKTVAGRVTYEVRLATPITFGAAATRHERTVSDSIVEGTAVELDVQVGAPARPGAGLLAEFATGDLLVEDETFRAIQALAWYHRAVTGRITGVEGVLRFSMGDPSSGRQDDVGTFVTPGLNLYFSGRTRLMFNWDVFKSQSDLVQTEHALRAQLQLYY